MKLIFVTDLHGSKWKYDRILKLAKELEVDAVLNSGDLLPKGVTQAQQEEFISGYLHNYFEQFESAGIYYIYYPGNDDPARFDPLFEKITNKYSFIIDIAQRKVELAGYEFVGMNWVVDYP
ncbi:MAG: metallophosphoesterase family protein, partial [Candidatus Aminicenantes bacterium]|nr:metallophosphoesterase family protein [Candidatus Aminicenantes bacterium]